MQEPLKVTGGQESYFTGILESYLRAKGIPYENPPLTMDRMMNALSQTGFLQIPQALRPDGTWLVDTTLIMDYLNREHPEPRTSPTDPAATFIALLLEDYAQEWLWRAAMHYRWSFKNSAKLESNWLASAASDSEESLAKNEEFFFNRQLSIFVDGDGVNSETKEAVESSYYHALRTLEAIFAKRDFILGDRPTQADFGFFGPFFRHFFCDPDPVRIMREIAPGVHEWVARMWNIKPERFSSAAQIEAIPDDLSDLLEPAVSVYLPYLLTMQEAVIAGQDQVSYDALGVGWTEPTKPYRAWCLDQLRRPYQALEDEARARVDDVLGEANAEEAANAKRILSMPPTGHNDDVVGSLPYPAQVNRTPLDSWGRPLNEDSGTGSYKPPS